MSRVLHIRVPCWTAGANHHGLWFLDDGRIFHMARFNRGDGKAGAYPHWTTLEDFAGATGVGAVDVEQHAPEAIDPVEVVLARAESLLGRRDYHLLSNNCEAVVRWCLTGDRRSVQVDTVTGHGVGVGLGSAAAWITLSAVATGASAAEIMGALRFVGGAVGTGAAGGAVAPTAAPAAFAIAGVHRAFRDDPAAPVAERRALSNGRAAGTVGAVGAGLVMLEVISAAGVPGLSAVGITSGLAAVGGTMAGGVAVTLAAPVTLAFGLAWLVYRASRKR